MVFAIIQKTNVFCFIIILINKSERHNIMYNCAYTIHAISKLNHRSCSLDTWHLDMMRLKLNLNYFCYLAVFCIVYVGMGALLGILLVIQERQNNETEVAFTLGSTPTILEPCIMLNAKGIRLVKKYCAI